MNHITQHIKNLFLNDLCVLILVLINTAVIFVQYYTQSQYMLNVLTWVDFSITILFVAELSIKIRSYGFRNYIQDSWNKFDFFIIIVSAFSLLPMLLPSNEVVTSLQSSIPALRALRIFNSVRLPRFFPEFRNIAHGVKQGLRASSIVIFTFIILLIISSIITCSIFDTYLPQYFGTPIRSIYTMARLFTVEGWYEIPDALTGVIASPTWCIIAKFYFVCLVFGGGVLGLSFINSIIVDAMVSDNNDDLKQQVTDLTKKVDKLTELLERATQQSAHSESDRNESV